jgi:membrane dipeptidase
MRELSRLEEERALEIHEKSIFINALDSAMSLHGPDYLINGYMPKLKKEGVTALQETICRPTLNGISTSMYDTIKTVGDWYNLFDKNSDSIFLATRAEDIINAKKDDKIAVVFGFQHAEPIEDDLNLLKIFHKLGFRVIELTYNERNRIGDGCLERTNSGLSNFGIDVIGEMNRLGILIDLSHVGDKTTLDAIEVSKDPCCYTHANPRALMNKARNKTDEQIKALAEKGGVIGITFFTHLIRDDKLPTFGDDFVDHIEYAVDLVGVDHVGTGLDIPYGVSVDHPIYKNLLSKYAEGYIQEGYTISERLNWYKNEENRWFDITRGLVARGYSDQEIEKILGLNFLKLFRKVWRR